MVSFRTLLYAITLASAALGQGPQPVVLALHDSSYDSCDLLTSLLLPNASILQVSHLPANSEFPVPGSCLDIAFNKVDLCRVYGVIWTSSSSSVRFEVWLPKADNWYGRILSTGNGGLGGCEYHPPFFLLPVLTLGASQVSIMQTLIMVHHFILPPSVPMQDMMVSALYPCIVARKLSTIFPIDLSMPRPSSVK